MAYTEAQATALLGSNLKLFPAGVKLPGINSENAYVEYATFYMNLLSAATGQPLVDQSNFSPPVTYFDDFVVGGYVVDDEGADESNPGAKFCEVADAGEWLVSVATTGEAWAAVIADTPGVGGWLAATTVATQNHPINAQLNGSMFNLAAGKPLYFETRIMVSDVDKATWFVGLSIPTTDGLASGVGTVNDIIGFAGLADGTIDFISNDGGTDSIETEVGTIADGSLATIATKAKRLGFAWDGIATVTAYIDGVEVASFNTTDDNINQDAAMSPLFIVDNTGAAAAHTLWIDYIMVTQKR
jgi:hypothetical protein